MRSRDPIGLILVLTGLISLTLNCTFAHADPKRTFEVDLLSTGGDINRAISVKVTPGSFVDPEGSGGRFCTGNPCVVVNESNEGGVTGIWIQGVQASTESPLGKTVKFEVDRESVAVFYDGVLKATQSLSWPEPQARFWFRVRAGGTPPENGIGTFDSFRVDGSLVDDFNLANGSPPNAGTWAELSTTTSGGGASIQGNALRIESIRIGAGAPEAVRWLKQNQTYLLPSSIPTVSVWGIVIIGLLICTGGTLILAHTCHSRLAKQYINGDM